MQIVCKRCKHTWDYTGNARRISCSKCKTSITLQNQNPYVKQPETHTTVHVPIITTQKTFILTLELLDSIKFSRAKAWAKTNGQDSIELKVDDKGILSL
jgi:LSD1 subclass zinc finger protein